MKRAIDSFRDRGVIMAKENEEGMDSGEIRYPCTTCGSWGGGKCSDIRCPKWASWFGTRWKEVTQPFLPIDR